MILSYEAVDAGGKNKRDTIEAPSIRAAVEQLRRDGLFVASIQEQPQQRAAKNTPVLAEGARRKGLPLKVLVLMTRQMTMLLHAGSAIVPAFASIRRQMSKPQQAALLDAIIADLEEGVPLAEAFKKHPADFDPVYCAIIAAGEASATLVDGFSRLAEIVGKQNAMRKRIFGALAYPGLLITMCTGIFGVMLFFVMPRFGTMFEQLHVDIPASTAFMLALGTGLRDYWWLLLGALLACGAAVHLLFRSDGGKEWLGNTMLRVPLIGPLMSRVIQGQVFRTMGVLLETKVGVLETIELARAITKHARFVALFNRLDEAVTGGGQLSNAFEASGLVEPAVCQAIRTGEESGNLGGAITYAADTLDETNTEMINAATRLIEPIILILMGLIVGVVAVSLFMPLFDMTAAVN